MPKSGTRVITCVIQTKDIPLGLLNFEDLGTTSIRNNGIRYSEERRKYVNIMVFFLEYVKIIFKKIWNSQYRVQGYSLLFQIIPY